ncbi:MAG TPA: glycosyltransferase family 9 protein [Geomonas sp.]|nr:glycosyltransferase family 9 protein [Geomonas sp.]
MVVAAYKYLQQFGLRRTAFRVAEVIFDFSLYFLVKFASRWTSLRRRIFLYCIKPGKGDPAAIFQTIAGAPRVGVLIIGGLGDSLFLSAMAAGILRKYPQARLFAFVRNRSHAGLFEGCDQFAGIFEIKGRSASILRLVAARELDVFHDNRYVVSTSSKLASHQELAAIQGAFRELERNWQVFPLNNHLYGELGLSLYELASRSTGMTMDADDLLIPLLGPELEVFDRFLPGFAPYGYLTIHHGSDNKMVLPDGSGCALQTKNWHLDRWAEAVSHFSALGWPVIQLGLADEESIPGTVNLLGKLSVKQTAAVLKYASFHLDSEGGLVHLSQAVKTRSVVVFGPTPISLFGYPKNANVAAGECANCFWSDVRWFMRCPKGNPTASCMDAITAARVIEAAGGIAARRLLPGAEVLELACRDGADRAAPAPSASGDAFLLERIGQPAGHRKTVAVVGNRCGELALRFREAGWQVNSAALRVADSEADRYRFLGRHGRDIGFRFASVFNLPFEDASQDAVAWTASLQEIAQHRFALYELLRVVKPGGLLAFSYPLPEGGADAEAVGAAFNNLTRTLAGLGAVAAGTPLATEWADATAAVIGVVLKKLPVPEDSALAGPLPAINQNIPQDHASMGMVQV